MKKISKILSSILFVTMFVASTMVTYAADVTEEGTSDVPVTVNVSSEFRVSLPASIELTKSQPSKDYDIKVVADLDPRYKIVVAPVDCYTAEQGDTTSNSNLLLKDTVTGVTPKADIIATIAATSTEVTADISDLSTTGVILTHTISVNPDDLTAGTWTGTMKYSITLDNN